MHACRQELTLAGYVGQWDHGASVSVFQKFFHRDRLRGHILWHLKGVIVRGPEFHLQGYRGGHQP